MDAVLIRIRNIFDSPSAAYDPRSPKCRVSFPDSSFDTIRDGVLSSVAAARAARASAAGGAPPELSTALRDLAIVNELLVEFVDDPIEELRTSNRLNSADSPPWIAKTIVGGVFAALKKILDEEAARVKDNADIVAAFSTDAQKALHDDRSIYVAALEKVRVVLNRRVRIDHPQIAFTRVCETR